MACGSTWEKYPIGVGTRRTVSDNQPGAWVWVGMKRSREAFVPILSIYIDVVSSCLIYYSLIDDYDDDHTFVLWRDPDRLSVEGEI